tara:strand:- start:1449 stop:1718 length:270 start_codon:yes stop_codon:yes gene_type:complete
MPRKKKKQKFTMPSSILGQINECSTGGFVLFNFDEDGESQIHASFDDEAHFLALHSHIHGWSQAIADLQTDHYLDILSAPQKKRGRKNS